MVYCEFGGVLSRQEIIMFELINTRCLVLAVTRFLISLMQMSVQLMIMNLKAHGHIKTSIPLEDVLKNSSCSNHMQKVLQRQASLTNDKPISERCHDAPTNMWRYKRAASFDSAGGVSF